MQISGSTRKVERTSLELTEVQEVVAARRVDQLSDPLLASRVDKVAPNFRDLS